MLMGFGRLTLGDLGSLGSAGGSGVSLPTAPVLAMDPIWVTTDATPDFIADVDNTVAAGDDIRLQIQAVGGDWSILVSDTTHTITAPEDAANEASFANGSLSNSDYEARANVTHVTTSNWSNTVSFTVAAVSSNYTAVRISHLQY